MDSGFVYLIVKVIAAGLGLAVTTLGLMNAGYKWRHTKELKASLRMAEKVKENAEEIINNTDNPFDSAAKLRARKRK